jgi:signal peptidase I
MLGSVERYSSSSRRRRAGLLWSRTLRILFIAFILYLLVSRLLVTTFRVDSVSMAPTLEPSDKILVSVVSYGARIPFTSIRLPGLEAPKRGEVVVVNPPFSSDESSLRTILEPFVSFFSLQKATLVRELDGSRVQQFLVKRVVGVPGDTIRMQGYAVSIKPRGAPEFLPESELMERTGEISSPPTVQGWKPAFPFSGNVEETVLQSDQYFVLGDDRPDSSDSRSWGPVPSSKICAKVILRYWPPSRFGKP